MKASEHFSNADYITKEWMVNFYSYCVCVIIISGINKFHLWQVRYTLDYQINFCSRYAGNCNESDPNYM